MSIIENSTKWAIAGALVLTPLAMRSFSGVSAPKSWQCRVFIGDGVGNIVDTKTGEVIAETGHVSKMNDITGAPITADALFIKDATHSAEGDLTATVTDGFRVKDQTCVLKTDGSLQPYIFGLIAPLKYNVTKISYDI